MVNLLIINHFDRATKDFPFCIFYGQADLSIFDESWRSRTDLQAQEVRDKVVPSVKRADRHAVLRNRGPNFSGDGRKDGWTESRIATEGWGRDPECACVYKHGSNLLNQFSMLYERIVGWLCCFTSRREEWYTEELQSSNYEREDDGWELGGLNRRRCHGITKPHGSGLEFEGPSKRM